MSDAATTETPARATMTRAEYDRIVREGQEAAELIERTQRVEAARADPAAALEHFLRDEETGARITLQPCHHALIRDLLTHENVVCTASPEMGKTQIGIGLALYLLGKATEAGVALRIAFAAETFTISARMASTAAKYIAGDTEGARAYRELFPSVRPSSSESWSEEGGYYVERRNPVKDPSIVAIGLDTGILSARVDLLIMDDAVTLRNSLTVYQRKKVVTKYDGELSHRTTANARQWLFGNAWWEGDLLDVLGKRKEWHPVRLTSMAEDGASNWVDRWPPTRLARVRENNPEWRRLLLAERRRVAEGNLFGESVDKALERGVGLATVRRVEPGTCDGWQVAIGVDLGFLERKANADPLATRSAFFVWGKLADGRKRVLCCVSGQWSSHEWFATAHRLNADFAVMGVPPTFIVESNGGQKWIAEQAGSSGLDVRCFYTGNNKWDPVQGFNSLANDMMRGETIIPCEAGPVVVDEEIEAWIAELRAFAPGSHTGDRGMASWIGAAGLRMAAAAVYGVGTAGDALDEAVRSAEVERLRAQNAQHDQAARIAADEREAQVQAQVGAFWGSIADQLAGG